MTFRHIVLLKWIDSATEEQKAAVLEELSKLPAEIPQMRSYTLGPDAGVSEGNYDFGIIGEFDSAEDFFVYRDHPLHQQVISERIKPILAARAAVQHQI
ncbi:Dabb family protein [Nonomuraea sp. NPDC050663]|uniref:Dabb family protein n=1 Tax=Nonomuraea sp. NPDC050663 TaxID=3364370 RepID=UPI00378F54DF